VNPNQAIFVLDSYALMAYLGDEPGRARLEKVLEEAKDGRCKFLLCMINFGEVLYMTERHRGLVKAQKVQALIESLPIDLVDASRNLVLDAAHIKANHTLSYADAFVVALAQREGGVVLTGDPEFQAVEELINIEWLPK
jgi:predicted nucleic acid-binding protein